MSSTPPGGSISKNSHKCLFCCRSFPSAATKQRHANTAHAREQLLIPPPPDTDEEEEGPAASPGSSSSGGVLGNSTVADSAAATSFPYVAAAAAAPRVNPTTAVMPPVCVAMPAKRGAVAGAAGTVGRMAGGGHPPLPRTTHPPPTEPPPSPATPSADGGPAVAGTPLAATAVAPPTAGSAIAAMSQPRDTPPLLWGAPTALKAVEERPAGGECVPSPPSCTPQPACRPSPPPPRRHSSTPPPPGHGGRSSPERRRTGQQWRRRWLWGT